MQSGDGRRRVESSKGFVLLLVVGLVAMTSAVLLGRLVLSTEASRQDRTKLSQDGLNRAKAFVLDYLRKNHVLPDVSTFQTGTSNLTDAWGRRLLYFPSATLLSSDACAITTTNIALSQCGNDPACSSPITTTNIPFLILSGGEYVKSTTDPVFQSSPYSASVSIASATTFKQYRSLLDVGPYATPTNAQAIYDDLILSSSLPDVYSTAGCLSKTQGDVQSSGGVLKILNTAAALPPAVCPNDYTKTLFAYGRTGTYSWSILGLPFGLAAISSVTNSIAISGVPSVIDGTYPISVNVTDSAGRTDSRSYNLPVSNCCNWADSGLTQQLPCSSAAFIGSIDQKEQTRCNGTTQWVTTGNSCVAAPVASFSGRFGELITTGGFPSGSTDSGQTSLTIGSGASQITFSATSNITRHNTTSVSPALGVAGGGSDAVDAAQTINVDFNGGYGRRLGVEFRGLQIDRGTGADTMEEAIIVFKDTNVGTTVATYLISACMSGGTSGPATIGSTFTLPDVGVPFNRIEVTANNSPAATDFFIRGIRTCDVGATTCYPAGSSTNYCTYP